MARNRTRGVWPGVAAAGLAAMMLLAGCGEEEEPLDGEETPASTLVEPDATASHTPEQPTPFPTRAPGPPAPAMMVDLDTFSEEWLERVTPVPETGVIILSSQEWRVTYYSVSGDSEELVETVKRETGVEFAYPAYVPEGLALQHIVAGRELLGPDNFGGYRGESISPGRKRSSPDSSGSETSGHRRKFR